MLTRPPGAPASGAPESADVSDLATLRSVTGAPAAATARKILPELDPHAARFVSLARLVAIAVERPDGRLDVAARGGAAGVAVAVGRSELWIADTFDRRIGAAFDAVPEGSRAGALVLVPGLCETLRVNGRARAERDPEALRATFGDPAPSAALRIDVDEAYFHCAKALIRSALWSGAPQSKPPDGELSFLLRSETLDAPHRGWLARAPFALLATRDAAGRADVSPRGDPPGFVRVLDRRTVLLPDRPGNRLLDSLRNVLDQPQVALLALVPGERAALRLTGLAAVTRDPALLEPSAVQQRAPLLGLRIAVAEVTLERRPEPFAASGLWDPAEHVARSAFPSLGRVLADQLGPGGLRGRIAGRAIDTALRRDARRNLY